jgi:DNA-binding MarR family transcriptional regulator
VRERSTSDRRVVYIKLTPRGRQLAREIRVEPLEIFRDALASLSQDDCEGPLAHPLKLQKRVRGPRGRIAGRGALAARRTEES